MPPIIPSVVSYILILLDDDYEPIRKKTKANEIVVAEEEAPAEQNGEPYFGQFSRIFFHISACALATDAESVSHLMDEVSSVLGEPTGQLGLFSSSRQLL